MKPSTAGHAQNSCPSGFYFYQLFPLEALTVDSEGKLTPLMKFTCLPKQKPMYFYDSKSFYKCLLTLNCTEEGF